MRIYSLYGVKLSKYIENFPKGLIGYTNEELVFRFGKNCYAKNVIILIIKKKKKNNSNKVKSITTTKNVIHRTLL